MTIGEPLLRLGDDIVVFYRIDGVGGYE
jgi:hypothetical protein